MNSQIKLWTVKNGKLTELSENFFSQSHKEKDLEDWVEQNPSLLGHPDITIIGRQVYIPGVGPLDLLAINQNGRLLVIEFKRQLSTRDSLAQILDYASSIQKMDLEQLRGLKNVYASELGEVTDFDPIMILIAADADEAVERIVNYLASKARLAIEVVTFTYATLEDGREIIARSILIPEKPSAHTESTDTTLPGLLKKAAERKVLKLVEILRGVTAFAWGEQPVHVNGGSLRYWIAAPDGKTRMAFGINVGGEKYDSPQGSLDVWVWPEICAEFSESSIDDVWKDLGQFQALKASNKRFFTRIHDDETAERFLSLLSKWDKGSAEHRLKVEAEMSEAEGE